MTLYKINTVYSPRWIHTFWLSLAPILAAYILVWGSNIFQPRGIRDFFCMESQCFLTSALLPNEVESYPRHRLESVMCSAWGERLLPQGLDYSVTQKQLLPFLQGTHQSQSLDNPYYFIGSVGGMKTIRSSVVRSRNPLLLAQRGSVSGKIVSKDFGAFDAVIEGNLYKTILRKGIPSSLIKEITQSFSHDVDFLRALRSGDRFSVLYGISKTGSKKNSAKNHYRLIFASFSCNGKNHKFYRFQPPGGISAFYNSEGIAIRKVFLKTPVYGARLTSLFGYRRHPLFGYIKLHRGIDFAAPVGTPVQAAGDGVIEKVAHYGGYGKYVLIHHHNSEYKTAYAHLSRYAPGLKVGQIVKQGSIIAYVGNTGHATGPHLHFELWKNGVPVDPLKMTLWPQGKLTGQSLRQFRAHITRCQDHYRKLLPASFQNRG